MKRKDSDGVSLNYGRAQQRKTLRNTRAHVSLYANSTSEEIQTLGCSSAQSILCSVKLDPVPGEQQAKQPGEQQAKQPYEQVEVFGICENEGTSKFYPSKSDKPNAPHSKVYVLGGSCCDSLCREGCGTVDEFLADESCRRTSVCCFLSLDPVSAAPATAVAATPDSADSLSDNQLRPGELPGASAGPFACKTQLIRKSATTLAEPTAGFPDSRRFPPPTAAAGDGEGKTRPYRRLRGNLSEEERREHRREQVTPKILGCNPGQHPRWRRLPSRCEYINIHGTLTSIGH